MTPKNSISIVTSNKEGPQEAKDYKIGDKLYEYKDLCKPLPGVFTLGFVINVVVDISEIHGWKSHTVLFDDHCKIVGLYEFTEDCDTGEIHNKHLKHIIMLDHVNVSEGRYGSWEDIDLEFRYGAGSYWDGAGRCSCTYFADRKTWASEELGVETGTPKEYHCGCPFNVEGGLQIY